jgi:hypothetical protein
MDQKEAGGRQQVEKKPSPFALARFAGEGTAVFGQ